MDGESYEAFEYKDISELKKELEGIRGRKEVSNKELYEAVQKLAQVMGSIVEVFGAAAEQMNLEEKELESSAKRHDTIMAKLDKLISQNKTIAEGVLSVADIVRAKQDAHAKKEDDKDSASTFLNQNYEQERQDISRQEHPQLHPQLARSFAQSAESRQGDLNEMKMPKSPAISNIPLGRYERSENIPTGRFEWNENISRGQRTMAPPMMPPITPPSPLTPDFGIQMPPMEPAPPPNLDLDLDEALSSLEQEPKKKGLFGMFKK